MEFEQQLLATLRRHWGFDSFRPQQESIVRSVLGGRDVCVVMPTGGGKSLCYQLPAAMMEQKTVVVISPLIALMQDQVAQLTRMGISAASLSAHEGPSRSQIMRNASKGVYRLIYLSPERIAREETVSWLRTVPIAMFAIDEAHCISEWGHEFRPDYRQLSALRRNFPNRPIAAFTASATQQVRHDIIKQLQLKEPDRYIVSFYRKNLRYIVKECDKQTHSTLFMKSVRQYEGSHVIVYAPTISQVEDTVESLKENGFSAIGYHGKMDGRTRAKNQEMWMSGKVRVLVGTLAFGLGIDKGGVRAVIHLSLPKSIEQFYQEAGRAGRDGKPADCILLWRKKDVGLHAYFIEQMEDRQEKNRAWDRYHTIKDFAENGVCRHLQICKHFGEKPKWTSCDSCDVCTGQLEWLAAASPRKKPKARPSLAKPEGVPSFSETAHARPPKQTGYPKFIKGNRKYSGKSFSGRQWHKKLTRASGYAAAASRYEKKPEVIVRQPRSSAPLPTLRPSGLDPRLREYLRSWRSDVAKRDGVEEHSVMGEAWLEDVARFEAGSMESILRVSEFAAANQQRYGKQILDALRTFQRQGENKKARGQASGSAD